jgi:hypothetical protein
VVSSLKANDPNNLSMPELLLLAEEKGGDKSKIFLDRIHYCSISNCSLQKKRQG